MTISDSKTTECLPEEKQKERFAEGTPYDDAFRTMTNDCPDLLVPVHLSAYQRCIILDMAKLVSGALTEKYRKVREGVEKIMLTKSRVHFLGYSLLL